MVVKCVYGWCGVRVESQDAWQRAETAACEWQRVWRRPRLDWMAHQGIISNPVICVE